MNVLLFTHSQDIDGMGCAVLAKQAFSNLTVVPTKTFDITSNVKKYIDNQKIYQYDQIFVTDLCIKEPILSEIAQNPKLKSKIIVLDHHKTEIEEGNDQYDFVHIIVSRNGRKESGTSLFYQYLLKNQLLKENSVLNEFAEWTRQYDVWDWKTMKNEKARNLHILFEVLGSDQYVSIMDQKVKTQNHIEFQEFEKQIIYKFDQVAFKTIRKLLKTMQVVELVIDQQTYRIGFISCPYKYRNDVNEYLKEENSFDIDMVGMIMTDIDTVSYRQVKNCDVSIVAKYFGGKGHFAASSNSQNNEAFQKVLSKLVF